MAQQSDDLNFASGLEQFHNIRRMLPSYLNNIGLRMLGERKHRVEHLATIEDVNKRRSYVREQMLKDLGGLPDRTPLNARVVGVLERTGYRIEKVIFESQPHFYVTANLYLPTTGHPPYPAILYPLGHERGGKTNPTWQQMLGSLATKGFVALAWDPIGQGERLQIFDEDLRESKVGNSTTEHTVVGTQCLLVGDHLARYTIWDGVRALDYLLSRKEVDPARIGLTGNSGGGTHTAYIAALDDRIQVAAPSCYITSWHLMLDTIGPQDAEQTLPLWLEEGLDYPDYLYAFAPKPYLLLSAIRDFFPIAGARETFAEAEKVYSAIGAREKVGMFEADDGHGYNKTRRLAAYDWFGRWLKGARDTDHEPQIEMATPEELSCTSTGQVSTSLGGESVFTLNQKRLEQLKANRLTPPGDLPGRVREAIRYEPPSGPLQVAHYGAITRSGYGIEKLIYESEPGIVIPALLYVPEAGASKKAAVLMVTGDGKAASTAEAEQFATSGTVVLSIDMRGTGETRVDTDVNSREFDHYFGDFSDIMTALLVGKTMAGMRALDVARGIDLLVSRKEVDPYQVYGYGKYEGALPLLYASVLDSRIRRVVLAGMLVSYESVVNSRVHRHVLEGVAPGMLKSYDLQDLVAALAPRDVWIVNGQDPLGHELPASQVRKEYQRALEAFHKEGASQAIHIRDRTPDQDITAPLR
ncbi:MAG TPA: acetylxylan esterase [Candidatus Dormibacteraeota bacterium]|nr:acetylxylan esterase [Candidatus Dormibacteraeota bacterium]